MFRLRRSGSPPTAKLREPPAWTSALRRGLYAMVRFWDVSDCSKQCAGRATRVAGSGGGWRRGDNRRPVVVVVRPVLLRVRRASGALEAAGRVRDLLAAGGHLASSPLSYSPGPPRSSPHGNEVPGSGDEPACAVSRRRGSCVGMVQQPPASTSLSYQPCKGLGNSRPTVPRAPDGDSGCERDELVVARGQGSTRPARR